MVHERAAAAETVGDAAETRRRCPSEEERGLNPRTVELDRRIACSLPSNSATNGAGDEDVQVHVEAVEQPAEPGGDTGLPLLRRELAQASVSRYGEGSDMGESFTPGSPSRRGPRSTPVSFSFRPFMLDEELVVVQPEQVQDRRVPVGDADAVLDRRAGRARRSRRRCVPPLTPPPAIQVQKAFLLWSRPALRSSLSAGSWAIGSRPNSPPQTTSVLSSRPRCFRSRSSAAIGWSVRSQAVLQVGRRGRCGCPRSGVDVELHEAHAALDQPAGDQAAAAVGVGRLAADAVHLLHRAAALLRDVERVGRRQLHPRGQFVAGDAGVERRAGRAARRL